MIFSILKTILLFKYVYCTKEPDRGSFLMPNTTMLATLGGLIKEYRLQKNISQLEIAFATDKYIVVGEVRDYRGMSFMSSIFVSWLE